MTFLIAQLGAWLSGKLLGRLGGRITQKAADMLSVWIVALVGLLISVGALYGAYCWAWDKGRDHERARWEAASAKIEAADKVADEKGLATAGETKKDIDDGNERARQAAAGSDDPLARGLDSLRAEKDRGSR